MAEPIRIFVSYSHKNEAHKDRLLTHLKLLQRLGELEDAEVAILGKPRRSSP